MLPTDYGMLGVTQAVPRADPCKQTAPLGRRLRANLPRPPKKSWPGYGVPAQVRAQHRLRDPLHARMLPPRLANPCPPE
uniref:Uncharacterized protein n=1 Tax=Globodera pallida TaxID=36090 RepID=A0A183CI13_GLOPA